MTDIVGFVEDFTDDQPEAPIRAFKIDDDIFHVTGEAPAGCLMDLAKMAQMDQNNPQQMAQLMGLMGDFLDGVLMPESAVRFAQRMRSPIKPIKSRQIVRLLRWLMAVYSGKEPTAPASSSPDGQGTTGPSSTDGALPVESTPGSFL